MGGATHSSHLSFGESNLVRRSFTIEAVSKMNHFNLQQIAFAAGEEMRDFASIADGKEPVVCPTCQLVEYQSGEDPREEHVDMGACIPRLRVNDNWSFSDF